MKAIVQDRYGSADVLEFKDVPTPVAGPGEVLVRVRATSQCSVTQSISLFVWQKLVRRASRSFS